MSRPRFYYPAPLPLETEAELPPDAAHHASRVLRMRTGDPLCIFDGEGHQREGVITGITGKHVAIGELGPVHSEVPAPLRLTLAQALSSSEKFDWIVQKATELGVAAIQPVQAQRSVAKLTGERATKRSEHWRGVILAACEQCGRNTLPQIAAPQDLGAWLAAQTDTPGSKFILLPEGATTLHAQPAPQSDITLLIGPEGGFSEEEARQALAAGFVPIRIGSRVLRTETAAIAGLAALQTLWGDFN